MSFLFSPCSPCCVYHCYHCVTCKSNLTPYSGGFVPDYSYSLNNHTIEQLSSSGTVVNTYITDASGYFCVGGQPLDISTPGIAKDNFASTPSGLFRTFDPLYGSMIFTNGGLQYTSGNTLYYELDFNFTDKYKCCTPCLFDKINSNDFQAELYIQNSGPSSASNQIGGLVTLQYISGLPPELVIPGITTFAPGWPITTNSYLTVTAPTVNPFNSNLVWPLKKPNNGLDILGNSALLTSDYQHVFSRTISWNYTYLVGGYISFGGGVWNYNGGFIHHAVGNYTEDLYAYINYGCDRPQIMYFGSGLTVGSYTVDGVPTNINVHGTNFSVILQDGVPGITPEYVSSCSPFDFFGSGFTSNFNGVVGLTAGPNDTLSFVGGGVNDQYFASVFE